jgi:hypothetical protein
MCGATSANVFSDSVVSGMPSLSMNATMPGSTAVIA